MKQFAHTYCLFALVVTSINVFFFRKMDKHSFYHHYFKVIEEVELRNSQEIAPAPGLWQAARQALTHVWSGLSLWLQALLIGLSILPRLDFRWWKLPTLAPPALHPLSVAPALHPVRGP